MIDLIRLPGRQLYMGRKACSSHAYHTGILYPLYDVLFTECIKLRCRVLSLGILPIVFYHDSIYHITERIFSLFQSLDCARYRGVNGRRYKASGFSYHLTDDHGIALFYHRLRRGTYMLGHKVDHFLTRREHRDGLIHGYFFHVIGMDATLECL